MPELNLNELLPKIKKELKEYYSCEVIGPVSWGKIAPYFDALKEKGLKIRTNSQPYGEETQITLYVDRKGGDQNA